MPSEETLRILEVLGVWVASIGTLAAVVVSLWLARKGYAIRLRPRVSHRIYVPPGGASHSEVILIEVTNKGLRQAQLMGLGWRTGLFSFGPCRRREAYQTVDVRVGNSSLPVELSDGQVAIYMIPATAATGEDWYAGLAEIAGSWLRRRTLRLLAWTSTGEMFTARPESSFMKQLNRAVAATATAKQAAR